MSGGVWENLSKIVLSDLRSYHVANWFFSIKIKMFFLPWVRWEGGGYFPVRDRIVTRKLGNANLLLRRAAL